MRDGAGRSSRGHEQGFPGSPPQKGTLLPMLTAEVINWKNYMKHCYITLKQTHTHHWAQWGPSSIACCPLWASGRTISFVCRRRRCGPGQTCWWRRESNSQGWCSCTQLRATRFASQRLAANRSPSVPRRTNTHTDQNKNIFNDGVKRKKGVRLAFSSSRYLVRWLRGWFHWAGNRIALHPLGARHCPALPTHPLSIV